MTATVAAPQGNQFAILLVMFLLVAFLYGAILWTREGTMDRHEDELAKHHEQLATLAGRIQSLADFLKVDINDPEDDSPAAIAAQERADALDELTRRSGEAGMYDDIEVDDSPGALQVYGGLSEVDKPDADTEESPVAPATVPDGMPLQVQSALIERPHKSDDAPMLERSVNIGGTVQTFRIRAPREDH